MRRLSVMAVVLVLGAVSAGAAFAAVSSSRSMAPPASDQTGDAVAGDEAAKSKGKAVGKKSASAATKPRAKPHSTKASPRVSPAPTPITGSVVHDPDDCGDVCVDGTPDADDCAIDDCSADDCSTDDCSADGTRTQPPSPSALDDDRDGDGGDCGKADGD